MCCSGFWGGDVDGLVNNIKPISNSEGPLEYDFYFIFVQMTRNNPSLALWVGGNEQIPPHDIKATVEHI